MCITNYVVHLAPSAHDKEVISSGAWPNDAITTAAQELLKSQSDGIYGFQSTENGRKLSLNLEMNFCMFFTSIIAIGWWCPT